VILVSLHKALNHKIAIQGLVILLLNPREYCYQHNLKKSRFYYWCRRINPRSVPVALVQLSSGSGLRLVVNNRYQVEIDERFSSGTLQHLLQVLESR